MEKKMENLGDLRREGTGGGELFANEIAGGDVRDTEEVREARGERRRCLFQRRGSQGKPTRQVGGHGGEEGTFGLAQQMRSPVAM